MIIRFGRGLLVLLAISVCYQASVAPVQALKLGEIGGLLGGVWHSVTFINHSHTKEILTGRSRSFPSPCLVDLLLSARVNH